MSKGLSNSEMCFQSKLLNRKYVPCSHGLLRVCMGSVRALGHEEKCHPVHRKLHHHVPNTFLVKRVKNNLE